MLPPIGGKETAHSSLRLVLLAAVMLIAASSCRLSPLAPARDLAQNAASGIGTAVRSSPAVDEPAQVPAIARLHGEVKHGTLYLTGQLDVRGRRVDMAYSPYRPGGWCLQVFLNADRRNTGYWLGFDYIVRGVEWDPASGTSIVRRITLEPGYPGGWGPESGTATIRVSHGSFAIAIPLGAIGGADGTLDFALETYATVACPDCDSGYSHEFAANYFGSSSADGRPPLASGFDQGTRGSGMPSLRPAGVPSASAYRMSSGLTLVR
jgi:hypothetical protein